MQPITIAHLSDLHFGEEKSDDVWNALIEYINDDLKPHLVLITGDIVNTPDPDLFKRAKTQLDRLRPLAAAHDRYRICPGNHDRFRLGNSAGKPSLLGRMLGTWTRPAHGELENYFQGGLVLTPDLPFDVTLPSEAQQNGGENRWNLRILGCDSCEERVYFAQGILNTKTITDLRNRALSDTDKDLVILLVHHHLLPIASLEKEQPDLKSLANVTGMLNAGTALNMLAASHVNLVLHGHEHHAQACRFRTYDAAYGEIAVVACGSSTGTRTLKGWSMKEARFNVLELHADRSVALRQVTGEKGYFAPASEPPVQLLDAEDVRRARFLRKASRTRSRNPPRSRLTKLLEFRSDRDAAVTESRTEWLVGDQWVMVTQNRTGTPTTASLQMQFADGKASEMFSDFIRTGDGDNSYTATFPLESRAGSSARRVITSWSWEAGAVLTQDELATIRDPGEFRKDGREFASVEAPDSDLEELTMVVKLPASLAPDLGHLEVWVSNLDNGRWERNVALGHLVEPLGRGLFSLRVPFPLPRWQYALSWPVAPGPGEGDPRWSRDLAANAAAIHNAICRSLYDRGGGGLPEDASVSLYLRSKTTKNRLSCAGQQGKAPDSLDFDEQSGIVRGAWWGRRPRAAAPEESDASGLFVEGDSYVALVPLLQPDSGMYPAAGLVRIAVRDRLLDSQKDHVSQISALRSIIGRIPPVWYR